MSLHELVECLATPLYTNYIPHKVFYGGGGGKNVNIKVGLSKKKC